MAFTGYFHIAYLTDDLDKAIAFHQTTLDGTAVRTFSTPDGGRVAYVRTGSTDLELIEPADKARLGGQTGLIFDHVGYLVDDLDAAMRSLQAKGLKFTPPTVNFIGVRVCMVEPATALGSKWHLTEIPPALRS